MIQDDGTSRARDKKLEWLAPVVDDAQEIKRYLTKGFLVLKDEKQGMRDQFMKEVLEKSLYPMDGQSHVRARYLKVTIS